MFFVFIRAWQRVVRCECYVLATCRFFPYGALILGAGHSWDIAKDDWPPVVGHIVKDDHDGRLAEVTKVSQLGSGTWVDLKYRDGDKLTKKPKNFEQKCF